MDRVQRMRHMREVELMTLKEIADEFGISKQRVHQLIGNTGSGVKHERLRKLVIPHPDKTNAALAKELGIQPNTVRGLRADRYYNLSPRNKGFEGHQVGIEAVANKLILLGMAVRLMPHREAHDILVNDCHRVCVSYGRVPRHSPSNLCVSPQWGFSVEHKETDFYAFVTVDLDMFIVPITAIPRKMKLVAFCWPTLRPTIGKFQRWHSRFDLLEVPCEHG